jgi:spore maturation protein CgeB
MRLFEATGTGAMLLTDRKKNLSELFEIGKAVVAYSSKEEAAMLVRHYLDHPEEAEQIARAEQARTLRDHTFAQRMQELVPILTRHMA